MVKYIYIIITTIIILLSSCVKQTSIREIKLEDNLRYNKIDFYVANKSGIEKRNRVYNTAFSQNSVDYIWYSLNLKKKILNIKDQEVILKEVWIDANSDEILSSNEQKIILPKGKGYFEYSAGYKGDNGWKKGIYKLEIYINNTIATKKVFSIK